MRIIISDRCKIWDIEDKEKYALVRFTTSRKVKDGDTRDQSLVDNGIAKGGYVSESHSFVRFVGHAYNKLKEFEIGDVITQLEGTENTEPYYDTNNNCTAYRNIPIYTIFNFEKYEYSQDSIGGIDRAPQVEETASIKEEVSTNNSASEECPF